jgi:hypothetical protein
MVQEILKCLAQAAVGLDPSLVQLAFQPALELCHDWATVGLMVDQTPLRRQLLLAGGRLVREDRVELVNHPLAFGGKNVLNLGELSPPMRQAVAADDRGFLRELIGRERIRHHDRRAALGFPQGQDLIQIFPSMGPPGKIQTDRLFPRTGYQTGAVHPGARLGLTGLHRCPVLLDQREDPGMGAARYFSCSNTG